VGFTATNGSTSEFTYTVPGPPVEQLANGLGPEASASGPTVTAPAPATDAATRPQARTAAADRSALRRIASPFRRERIPLNHSPIHARVRGPPSQRGKPKRALPRHERPQRLLQRAHRVQHRGRLVA